MPVWGLPAVDQCSWSGAKSRMLNVSSVRLSFVANCKLQLLVIGSRVHADLFSEEDIKSALAKVNRQLLFDMAVEINPHEQKLRFNRIGHELALHVR